MQNIKRVPPLKTARARRKTNKRVIFLVYLFFVSLLVILFLRSPLNKIHEITVNGLDLLTKDEVISQSGMALDMPFLGVDTGEAENLIRNLSPIMEVKVEKDFPGKILIEVKEYKRVGFLLENSGKLVPFLANGKTLPDRADRLTMIDKPIIREFASKDLLTELAGELGKLEEGILDRISEIEHQPVESDPYRLRLFMKDGFEVRTSIRKFAENMSWYPTFVSNWEKEGTEKGIFMLLEGKWFVPYQQDGQDSQDAPAEKQTPEKKEEDQVNESQ